MTDNPYYRLLALLRADGEEVTLAERAAGLTFGAAQDGARLLCLRLDGGLIGLCLLE